MDSVLSALLDTAAEPGCRAVLEHAYQVAAACHRGQRRRSGDPYVTHPVQVALICKGLGMDVASQCAALLHDVLADTPCTLAELRGEFGNEIAGLVEDLTQLDRWRYGHIAEAIDAAQDRYDQRVLIIKLADRLHNMRTLRYLPSATQQRKSNEVLDGFAPLARRLGLDTVERELVDLAQAVLAREAGERVPETAVESFRFPVLSRRLLSIGAVVLPAADRDRWLEDWTGELSTLRTCRRRAMFTLEMLTGMPRLAAALRSRITSAETTRR